MRERVGIIVGWVMSLVVLSVVPFIVTGISSRKGNGARAASGLCHECHLDIFDLYVTDSVNRSCQRGGGSRHLVRTGGEPMTNR